MAWLIRQRAVAKGKLNKLTNARSKLDDKIADLEKALTALDAVILLHEVPIDPLAIKGIQNREKRLYDYGVMTKGILECLKKANGVPINSAEIAVYVANFAGVPISATDHAVACISRRLNGMVHAGTVVRFHGLVTKDFGMWSLAAHLLAD